MREPVSSVLCWRPSAIAMRAGVVLEIEFPPGFRLMFDFLSLLAVNLKSILQVECLGNLSFCALFTSGRVVTVSSPLLIALVAVQTRSGRCACS